MTEPQNKPKKKPKIDDMIGDEEMKKTFDHVIDYILAKRVGAKGRPEYLVKWEGWHVRDATWEPEANFASPQIAEIFEAGLSEQMGVNKEESMGAKKKRQTGRPPKANNNASTTATRKKNKVSNETMASKIFEQLRLKHQKKRRSKLKPNANHVISPQSLFDVNLKIQKVIKSYEKLVGASKRKSSRMSCPSSPSKPTFREPSPPKTPSLREMRYQMREQSKTTSPASDGSASSNNSLENQNPIAGPSGRQNNRLQKSFKNRMIRVNNDSNKMHPISQMPSLFDFDFDAKDDAEDNAEAVDSGGVCKKFLNRVSERFDKKVYDCFLDTIIDYFRRSNELRVLLNNNGELIDGLFNILNPIESQVVSNESAVGDESTSSAADGEDLNGLINEWLAKLATELTNDQQTQFWHYIQNKDRKDVIMASPDFLWLRINELFDSHKDLKEEFLDYMPNFCLGIRKRLWNFRLSIDKSTDSH